MVLFIGAAKRAPLSRLVPGVDARFVGVSHVSEGHSLDRFSDNAHCGGLTTLEIFMLRFVIFPVDSRRVPRAEVLFMRI